MTEFNNRKNTTGKLFGGVFASSLLAIALCTSCTRRDTALDDRTRDTVIERETATTETTLSETAVSGTTTMDSDTDASVSTSTSDTDASAATSASETGTSRSYGSAYDQGPSESQAVSGTDSADPGSVNTQSVSSDATMGTGDQ